MTDLFGTFFKDEAGFIISAELVLVMTIGVLSMVVGLAAIRDSVVHELNDVSHAIGSVSQSYQVPGLESPCGAWTAGFGFHDSADECDCGPIVYTDIICKEDPSSGPAE